MTEQRKPDWRRSVLARVGRDILGISILEAARGGHIAFSTLANFEGGRYPLGARSEKRLLRFYLGMFAALSLPSPAPAEPATIENLYQVLAEAVASVQSQLLVEVSECLNRGSDDLLEAVVRASIATYPGRQRMRIAGLLAESAAARTAG